MTERTGNAREHDVRFEIVGDEFMECFRCATCGGASTFRLPDMTSAEWRTAHEAFMRTHPALRIKTGSRDVGSLLGEKLKTAFLPWGVGM